MKYLYLALLFLSACSNQNQHMSVCQVTTPGSQSTIHSYGDSITFGVGATEPCNSYQAVFTADAKADSDDQGIPGSRLDQEMSGIMSLQGQSSDINTLLPGFNDISQFGDDAAHLAQFQILLTNAITALSQQGKFVFVGTPIYASLTMQAALIPQHTNANVDLYVNVIKSVVSTLQAQGLSNVVLVDTNAIFNPETMTYGDFHPDDYGHSVLANAFYQKYLEVK